MCASVQCDLITHNQFHSCLNHSLALLSPSPLPLTRSTAPSSPAGRALAENTQQRSFMHTERMRLKLSLAVQTDILFISGESCLFLSINSKKLIFSSILFLHLCISKHFYPKHTLSKEPTMPGL